MSRGAKPNPKAQRRSAARLAAVQALYSMEIGGLSGEDAFAHAAASLGEDAAEALARPDADLAAFLVRGASAERAELDGLIAADLAHDWTIDRLEAVLRAILRAAVYEIKARPQTPARVAISEYVDVAHAFYAGPEPGLVNAVLDRVARRLRPAEFSVNPG